MRFFLRCEEIAIGEFSLQKASQLERAGVAVRTVLNECGEWEHREPVLYPGPTTPQHSLGLSSRFSKTLGIVNPPNKAVGPNCTLWSPEGSLLVSLMVNTSLYQSGG